MSEQAGEMFRVRLESFRLVQMPESLTTAFEIRGVAQSGEPFEHLIWVGRPSLGVMRSGADALKHSFGLAEVSGFLQALDEPEPFDLEGIARFLGDDQPLAGREIDVTIVRRVLGDKHKTPYTTTQFYRVGDTLKETA